MTLFISCQVAAKSLRGETLGEFQFCYGANFLNLRRGQFFAILGYVVGDSIVKILERTHIVIPACLITVRAGFGSVIPYEPLEPGCVADPDVQ